MYKYPNGTDFESNKKKQHIDYNTSVFKNGSSLVTYINFMDGFENQLNLRRPVNCFFK